jgi:hypothetical protein
MERYRRCSRVAPAPRGKRYPVAHLTVLALGQAPGDAQPTQQDLNERSLLLDIGRTSERSHREVECGLQLRNSRKLEPQLPFRIRETPLDCAERMRRRTAVYARPIRGTSDEALYSAKSRGRSQVQVKVA